MNPDRRRLSRAVRLVSAAVLGVALSGALVDPAAAKPTRPPAAPPAFHCPKIPEGGEAPITSQGASITAAPWWTTQLSLEAAHRVTLGKNVVVAVLDSGYDPVKNLDGATISGAAHNAVPGGGPMTDCVGHGTAVTGIIAAQPGQDPLYPGIAPDATILPIKITDTYDLPSTTALAGAIDYAADHGARVANLSFGALRDPGGILDQAVRHALAAHMIIVCAAGNNGQSGVNQGKANPPEYPAAWASKYPNVIAVSGVQQDGTPWPMSEFGSYVTVAGPASAMTLVARGSGYVSGQEGTSYATPVVTGTVALMLAANPALTVQQVKNRIEATAAVPPGDDPDPHYGYGTVDPYEAVAAVRDDNLPPLTARTASAAALPPLQPAKPASRSLQHTALALAGGLLGLAVVAVVLGALLRGRRRHAAPRRTLAS